MVGSASMTTPICTRLSAMPLAATVACMPTARRVRLSYVTGPTSCFSEPHGTRCREEENAAPANHGHRRQLETTGNAWGPVK